MLSIFIIPFCIMLFFLGLLNREPSFIIFSLAPFFSLVLVNLYDRILEVFKFAKDRRKRDET